jgi:hypothetical protein
MTRLYRISRRVLTATGCLGVLAAVVSAQGLQQRRATLVGNNERDRGKCTIEVVVDGAADIEMSGDSAIIRNQSGQRPQWRRFECTGPIPPNPVDFRFDGVDGRGRQQLIRDPRNGGVAIIRIQDQNGGAEGYTFDVTWGMAGGFSNQSPNNRRYTADQAVAACQQAISQQAAQRLSGGNVEFRSTSIDDQPGRADWVVGTFDSIGRGNQQERYQFSCAVDFDTGQVRSAEIQPSGNNRWGNGVPGNDRRAFSREEQQCERAVSDRLRSDRYSNPEVDAFNSSATGRPNVVDGVARAERNRQFHSFRFSCSFDRGNNPSVRSVRLRRQ